MENEKKYFFDNPKNLKRVLYTLYGSCVLLLLLDFVIHRHVKHSWENLWGFYPVYGFVGCVTLVLVAKWMRTFLMRPEDYYDEGDAEINQKPDSNEKYSADIGGNDVDA